MTDGGLGIIIVLVWLVVYMVGLNLIHKDKTKKKPINKWFPKDVGPHFKNLHLGYLSILEQIVGG